MKIKAHAIETGDLYEICSDNFWTSGENSKKVGTDGRPTITKTKLKIGEIIEIRYPYQWHFRTIDNKYYHASAEEISKKCKPFGKILEDVRFANEKGLSGILEEELYHKAVQGVIIEIKEPTP